MGTIQFKEANCKNCYKCIRVCTVKAISFKNEQAQIMEHNCVLCGKCLQACPQNAKTVVDDAAMVKSLIGRSEKVFASIAPSFAAVFNVEDAGIIYSALKKLGFSHAEETAAGAVYVSEAYDSLIKEKKMKNIISSACPVIVSLVEKYYPDLLDELAPVVSPMIAHARMMRKKYGAGIKVVFIGPCLAKKEEYRDFQNDNLIDAVITFEELRKWMDRDGVSLGEVENYEAPGIKDSKARFYPISGGILGTLGTANGGKYRYISIDGLDRCMEALESIRHGKVQGYFIEMNSCPGGCINGPCTGASSECFLESRDRIFNYAAKCTEKGPSRSMQCSGIDLSKRFYDRSKPYNMPDETAIREILKKIGKFSKEDELNCGACGYSSCREKAIAVYNNKAELRMCLPYMRERAESISNIIFNTTPNAIFALNHELRISEINTAAREMFNIPEHSLSGRSMLDMFDCQDFELVRDTGKDIINRKHTYERLGITVEQSIIYAGDYEAIIVIMKNITNEEKHKQQMYKVRSDTVETAQKVIEKQMRVAQEIASLLGETTAETKVALTKLKNSVLYDTGEEK
jgi:iron only hydrogenase large subunit-like protein